MFNLNPDFPTNSFIGIELIDFLGVETFNWVLDPYLVHVVNNLKINLRNNRLMVEHKFVRPLTNMKFAKYLIIYYGRI